VILTVSKLEKCKYEKESKNVEEEDGDTKTLKSF
jgi:hypothetical protein